MAALSYLPALALVRPPVGGLASWRRLGLGSLASWRDGTLLWMGARDPRTRKGKVFRGSNGLARAKPANATGWWHKLKSLVEIPVSPPSGGARKAAKGG